MDFFAADNGTLIPLFDLFGCIAMFCKEHIPKIGDFPEIINSSN